MGNYNIEKDLTATRRELGEDIEAERKEALAELTDLGLLIRFDDLELYHGRTNTDGKEWRVIRGYNNAGNASGNHNVNKVPALSVGSRDIAEGFAQARQRRDGGKAETHRIFAKNREARILNCDFDYNSLNTEDRKLCREALKKISLTEQEGKVFDYLVPELRDKRSKDYEEEKITRLIMENVPGWIPGLMLEYLDGKNVVEYQDDDDTVGSYIFSAQYIKRWMKKNYIVGVRRTVRSATLGKNIQIVHMLDLGEVSEKENNPQWQLNRKLGQAALKFYQVGEGKEEDESLKWKNEKAQRKNADFYNTLYDSKAEPEQLIEAAENVIGFRGIFEKQSGNWEKYTVAEHTETVLRNFENNYADAVPVGFLPIMKLCLLLHDVGKGVASEQGRKREQKIYNMQYAEKFLNTIGIPEKNKRLIIGIIGNKSINVASKQEVEVVGRIRKILQTCDSMAYSSYAEVRDRKTGARYRAAGSFDGSFEDEYGFLGNQARLKSDWNNGK